MNITAPPSERRVALDSVDAVVRLIFKTAGLSDANASIVSQAVLSAQLRGTRSHGLVRLPYLVDRLVQGGANANGYPTVLTEKAAIAVVDGDRALGPIAARIGMEIAIEKAKHTGIGAVTVRNSDFVGTCAHPAMQACSAGMIGLVWTNGHPGMAAWGGAERAIGNNPLGIAVPRGGEPPIVLDMAMSVSAGGRIRLYAESGKPIPADWAINAEGQPTSNPEEFILGGSLLALGHKGFGLAVIGEILAGVLAGARILSEVPEWFRIPEQPIGNGHFLMALDVAAFIDKSTFEARVSELVTTLTGSKVVAGAAPVRLPGARGNELEAEQRKMGLSLDQKSEANLLELADTLKISREVENLLQTVEEVGR